MFQDCMNDFKATSTIFYFKGGQIKIHGNPNTGYLNFSSGNPLK